MKLPLQILAAVIVSANMVIVFLVSFLAIQGMPPVDSLWNWAIRPARAEEEELGPAKSETPVTDWLVGKTVPLANLTGVATAPWSMFAPAPDATNHRFRTKIEYRDGTTVEWRSPIGPSFPAGSVFGPVANWNTSTRLSYGSPQVRWYAFADYLAAKNRQNPRPEGAPRRVTFIMEEAFIENPTDPEGPGWLPMSQPIPRDREDVITPKRVYPVPLELLKKERAASAGPAP